MIKQRKHEFEKFQLEKNSNHKYGETCHCYACYASAFARATELSREDGNKIRLMIASRSARGAPKVECWRHNIECVFFAGTSPVCPTYCSKFGEPDPVEAEPQLDVPETMNVVVVPPDALILNQRDILHEAHVWEPVRVPPRLSDVMMIKVEAPAIETQQEALCVLDSVDGEQTVSMDEGENDITNITTTTTMSTISSRVPESDGDAVDKVFEQTFFRYADSMVRRLDEQQFLPLYRIFVDRHPRISCSFRGSVDCLHFTKCDCRVHLVVCAPYLYEGDLYLFRKRQSMIEMLSDILYRHSEKEYDDAELEIKRGLLQEESANQLLMGSFVNRLSLYLHYYVERLDPQEFRFAQFLFIVKDIAHHFDVLSCVTAGCDHKDECYCHLKLRGRENLVPYVGLIFYHDLDYSIGRTIIELSSRFTVHGSHIVVLDGDEKEWDKKFSCHDPVISFSSYFEAFRNEESRVQRIVPSMRAFDVDDADRPIIKRRVKNKKKARGSPRRRQVAANVEWQERTLKAQISSSVSYTQQY
jgi:hypothetical protein